MFVLNFQFIFCDIKTKKKSLSIVFSNGKVQIGRSLSPKLVSHHTNLCGVSNPLKERHYRHWTTLSSRLGVKRWKKKEAKEKSKFNRKTKARNGKDQNRKIERKKRETVVTLNSRGAHRRNIQCKRALLSSLLFIFMVLLFILAFVLSLFFFVYFFALLFFILFSIFLFFAFLFYVISYAI